MGPGQSPWLPCVRAGGARKKPSGGKNESSVSGSGSVSGDTSAGLRRSTRETSSKKQSNSSPVSVRKSHRLENRTPPKVPVTAKKTNEKQSPLRRSERENKFQSSSSRMSEKGATSKSNMRQPKGLNTPSSKDKKKDEEEVGEEAKGKGIAEKGKQQSPKVGAKRKIKRLDARSYRDMFKPLRKKIKTPDSAQKTSWEDCNDSGDDEEGEQKHSDEEELKEESPKNIGTDTGVSNFDVEEKHVHEEKLCESQDIKSLQDSLTGDLLSCSPETEVKNDEAKDIEADCSVMENIHNQEEHLASRNELCDDSNGSKCNLKGTILRAPAAGTDDAVQPVSSTCKLSFLTAQCAKCYRKQRLDYNAPAQELCCCLSSLISEDRGKCGTYGSAQSAEERGQDMRQIDPPLDVERGTCVTCNHAGKLLDCGGKGCKRSYHPTCLSTPEVNTLLPVWYCSVCVKKRLTHGVHWVSQGVESILDVREVELSNSKGVEKQKQYLVKYKGLAHIHNHWVPEVQLLHQVPELLANFGEKEEGTQWKTEWAVPHRLLQKRSLVTDDHPDKHIDQDAGVVSTNGQCEWLVKWCGLDYDQATWELVDSPGFKTVDVQRLIREYETRQERARMAPLSGASEVQERRKGSQVKLGRLSSGVLSGADSCYLNSANKLREFYQKGHNAVLIDEQDRVVKVAYLVSSLVTNVYRPFLIITPYASLSSWEAEFLRIAASVNVVVYSGSTDARKIIRSLEFYEEGGNMMLQVLLSSIELISEDLEVLKGIEWGAVIVDDCQQSCISAHSGAIKNLASYWRLLIVNARLKDNAAEYVNILSLLEPGGNSKHNAGLMVDSSESIDILKERLCSFAVCARFLEYWVPVQISNLQLEHYFSLILSNSTSLCSCLKKDGFGSLRDTIISTRKCCDHPYIVDSSIQQSLQKSFPETPLLDLGIRASGKLQLLDEILTELRNQELKVLILFQSLGGTGRDTTGDILEDFLNFRFGSETYEHLGGGCVSSKKQDALNRFNKERKRSFFLLETRACFPSIKLSSVDAVIIFNSDWNPLNDLKALQRITIETKLEQIKVFRLYCACTVEEKVLILAKNDMTLDGTLQGISPSTSHMLLMWGSSYLFTKLDEFHRDSVNDCGDHIVPKNSFLKGVCEEMLYIIQNQETIISSKFISVARQSGGSYLKDISLIGEQKIQLEDGVPPHVFWTKLLEGKQPQWKYLPGSSQRTRKRAQHLGESLMPSEVQADEVTKKRKKMESSKVDYSSQQVGNLEKPIVANKACHERPGTAMTDNAESREDLNPALHKNSGRTLPPVTTDIAAVPAMTVDIGDRISLYNEQRGLFQVLKPDILCLCDALELQDEGKRLVEQFLEYVVNNHPVIREPETILQAFQIAVCWTAAAVLNQTIDHKKSLVIAREKMNFSCGEDEADYEYSKMKLLSKIFIRRTEGLKMSNSSKDRSTINGIIRGSKENVVLEESSRRVDCFVSPGQTTNTENVILRKIKKVKKKCDNLMGKLKDKQNEETEEFTNLWEEERAELEKRYRMESALIRTIHGKSSVGVEKLKNLDNNHAKEREKLESQILIRRKEVEVRQQVERDELQKKTALCLEQLKSLAQEELLGNPPSENGNQLQDAEYIEPCKLSNGTPINGQQNSDMETSRRHRSEMALDASEAAKSQVNILTTEVQSLMTEKQKVNCQDDATMNFSEAVPLSKEVGSNNLAEELSPRADLPKLQSSIDVSAEPIAEPRCQEGFLDHPRAVQTREMEKNTKQMNSVEVNRSTALETNQFNGTSSSLFCRSTEPLPSPGISLTGVPAADLSSVGTLPVSQGLRDESCQINVIGAEERVQHSTGIHNILHHSVTASLGLPYPLPSDLCRNGAGVALSGRLDNGRGEAHTSAQGTIMPIQQQGISANISGETVSHTVTELAVDHAVDVSLGQSVAHTSVTRGALPARASYPTSIQGPSFPISRSSAPSPPDPLGNELDRIRKEIGEVINIHEETTLRLKSERDKEIEEIVAQIHKKYEGKMKEAEASFSLKRNELEMNQEKVMMHFFLAQALRSKCIDTKASPGTQQVVSSGSVEHFIHSQPAARPSFTPGNPHVISPRNAVLPVRAVHPSSALDSSPTPRSPHINPLAPTAGLQEIRSSYRAPAPHLQPFRPASMPVSSSSMSSVSCGALAQQPPSNTPPSLSAPPRPTHLPAILKPNDQSQQHEVIGSTPVLNLSVSATELLLMEMQKQNEANLGGNIPPLPDNVQNSESWDISEFGTAARVQLPSCSLGVVNNVVCLSDDE